MSSTELSYFRRRANEERERAATAPTAHIRAIHLELAVKYEELADCRGAVSHVQDSIDALHRSSHLLTETSGFAEQS